MLTPQRRDSASEVWELKCPASVQIAAGKTLSEVEVDTFLTGRRAAQAGFIEPSFPTIAGSGPHGAIIHYRAEPETCGTVSASQLLLVDSGASQKLFVNGS